MLEGDIVGNQKVCHSLHFNRIFDCVRDNVFYIDPTTCSAPGSTTVLASLALSMSAVKRTVVCSVETCVIA